MLSSRSKPFKQATLSCPGSCRLSASQQGMMQLLNIDGRGVLLSRAPGDCAISTADGQPLISLKPLWSPPAAEFDVNKSRSVPSQRSAQQGGVMQEVPSAAAGGRVLVPNFKRAMGHEYHGSSYVEPFIGSADRLATE